MQVRVVNVYGQGKILGVEFGIFELGFYVLGGVQEEFFFNCGVIGRRGDNFLVFVMCLELQYVFGQCKNMVFQYCDIYGFGDVFKGVIFKVFQLVVKCGVCCEENDWNVIGFDIFFQFFIKVKFI